MVGYSWATGMVDSVASVMKKTDFQNAGFPQVENELAKTALGQMGLLGPAGSGASIWKTPMVTLDSGSGQGRSGTTVHNHYLSVDGGQFRLVAQQVVDNAMDNLGGSIGMQVG